MQDKNAGYSIIKGIADNAELENYRQVFEKNGTERDITNLQWLHQQNIANTNTIYYAMHNEEIAAIYTALPVIFKINDVLLPALQSIDTMTDLDHRGKGLFPKLAAKLYSDAAENNFSLVYGFPNENSAPGFFKKLQWISFGEAPFLLKPINPFYFIKKFINRKKKLEDFSSFNHIYNAPKLKEINTSVVIKAIANFDESYDQIWKKVSKNIKVCINRNAEYMNWRYVNKPAEHYYRYGIFIEGQLKAVVVYAIKGKHGGRIGYIMDLIFEPNNGSAGKQLLKFTSQQFRLQQTDTVLTWSLPGSFNYACFKKSGYYSLPLKLRPQHLFLGVRAFNVAYSDLILDIKNWYISYSDSDTV